MIRRFLALFTRADSRSKLFMAAAQLLLIGIGVAGAMGRAFFKDDYSRTLNLDIVTVAWIGVAIIGFILPEISEFGFGDVKVKVSRLRKGAEDIEQTLVDAANLAQNWSTSIAIFLMMMQKRSADLPEAKEEIFRKYIRDRMGEAKMFLGDDPGEAVRIVLWLFEPSEKSFALPVLLPGDRHPPKACSRLVKGWLDKRSRRATTNNAILTK